MRSAIEHDVTSANQDVCLRIIFTTICVYCVTTSANKVAADVRPSSSSSSSSSSSDLTMLSRAQTYHVTPGSTVVLHCEFHFPGFRMFDNPVVWQKMQADDQQHHLNMLGVVLEPFAQTRRFEIRYEDDRKDTYELQLRIKETALEDTGNYTCEVRGRRSLVLLNVIHTVYVSGPLTYLFLISGLEPTNASHPLTRLSVREGQPTALACVTRGPCPLGEMSIQVGERDVSALFRRSPTAVRMSGSGGGMRVMECVAWTSTAALELGEQSHGKYLRCFVDLSPEIGSNWTQIRIDVTYAPRIRCRPAVAHLGDREGHLECTVRARPDPITLFWIIGPNGTTVAGNDVTNEYRTMVRVSEDGGFVTKLFMRSVTTDSFRKYTVVAENIVGSTSYVVELSPASRPSSPSLPKRTPLEDLSLSPVERHFSSSSSDLEKSSSGADSSSLFSRSSISNHAHRPTSPSSSPPICALLLALVVYATTYYIRCTTAAAAAAAAEVRIGLPCAVSVVRRPRFYLRLPDDDNDDDATFAVGLRELT